MTNIISSLTSPFSIRFKTDDNHQKITSLSIFTKVKVVALSILLSVGAVTFGSIAFPATLGFKSIALISLITFHFLAHRARNERICQLKLLDEERVLLDQKNSQNDGEDISAPKIISNSIQSSEGNAIKQLCKETDLQIEESRECLFKIYRSSDVAEFKDIFLLEVQKLETLLANLNKNCSSSQAVDIRDKIKDLIIEFKINLAKICTNKFTRDFIQIKAINDLNELEKRINDEIKNLSSSIIKTPDPSYQCITSNTKIADCILEANCFLSDKKLKNEIINFEELKKIQDLNVFKEKCKEQINRVNNLKLNDGNYHTSKINKAIDEHILSMQNELISRVLKQSAEAFKKMKNFNDIAEYEKFADEEIEELKKESIGMFSEISSKIDTKINKIQNWPQKREQFKSFYEKMFELKNLKLKINEIKLNCEDNEFTVVRQKLTNIMDQAYEVARSLHQMKNESISDNHKMSKMFMSLNLAMISIISKFNGRLEVLQKSNIYPTLNEIMKIPYFELR